MNTKVGKKTYDQVDAEMRNKYFTNKVDMIPATIKTVSACLNGKDETVVSRILEVDGKPFMGIDYADNGEPIGAWMSDARGRRVPINTEKEITPEQTNNVLGKITSNLLKRVQKEKAKAPTTDEKENVSKAKTTRTTNISRERDFS